MLSSNHLRGAIGAIAALLLITTIGVYSVNHSASGPLPWQGMWLIKSLAIALLGADCILVDILGIPRVHDGLLFLLGVLCIAVSLGMMLAWAATLFF